MKPGPKAPPLVKALPFLGETDWPSERVMNFCRHHLTHVKGELAGQPLVLAPWQVQDIVKPLFDTRTSDGMRTIRTCFVEVPRKNAKALSVETPIPTPDGWTTMGAIREGDTVFDERGGPVRVLDVSDVMHGHDCYRVSFSDGTSMIADAKHLWYTRARQHGEGKSHVHGLDLFRAVRTTDEIRQSLCVSGGEANHAVPIAGALQCPELDLPLPPYVLGAWVGDGTTANGGFTCAEPAIIAEIRAEGVAVRALGRYGFRYWFGDGSRAQAARNDSPQAILRQLGVLGRKYIPEGYLRGSIAQRFALLQGLMDTDGTVSKKGQCVFTTTNPELRDGVLDLLRGLGFKASLTTEFARLHRRIIGEAYDIQFWSPASIPVFRLPRKAGRQKAALHPTRRHWKTITRVESVPSVPVRCIAVDAPSHLYLAGDGMTPTHNSTLGAAIGLYLLYADDEPGAEIVSAAADREQAAIVFDIAKSMVEASPVLSARAKIYRREIVVPSKTGDSMYKVISSESYTKHGMNLHGAIIDEVHAHQDGGELYGVLTKGMGSRRQPVTFAITTAGHDRKETSLCWQLHQRALRVQAGHTIDPSFLGVVYAAPENADWTDKKVWALANPGLGVTVKEAFLEQECRRAQDMPAYENEFRQYHLDQWCESIKAWLQMSKWDKCATPVNREALKGRRCFGGLDMATNTDLAALVLVFPDDAGGFDVLVHAWCPEAGIRRRSQRDHAPYDVWVRQGHLEATESDAVDQEMIRARILEYAAEFEIAELGYDDWNMGYLGPKLLADGVNLRPIRQTFKALSGATKHLERCVLKRALRHGGQPVLRWCIANTVVMKDGPENVKPSKEKSPERIDLTVALVMALECAGTDAGPSIYAQRGVVAL